MPDMKWLPPAVDTDTLVAAFYLTNAFRWALKSSVEEAQRFLEERGEELENALHLCSKTVHRDLLERGAQF